MPGPMVSGVPQGVPRVGGDPHFLYVLGHADDNLVVAQRLGEWISRAPDLEEDIALGNIGLDHLGVARALLSHAAALEGAGRDEDGLAYLRGEREFTNLLLAEQPNSDFAHTMTRQLLLDAYQVELWDALSNSSDHVLAGIAAKAVKEARYHLRHSSAWMMRLGDGTDESHARAQRAIDGLWRFTGEMFDTDDVTESAIRTGIGADPARLHAGWLERIQDVLSRSTLGLPTDPYQRGGGRQGFHTEHLGHLLGEMQWMQRTYPGLTW